MTAVTYFFLPFAALFRGGFLCCLFVATPMGVLSRQLVIER
jgi:hypothetical protein